MKTSFLARLAKLFAPEHERPEQSALARTSRLNQLEFRNSLLVTQMETAPDGILLVDENARIVSYNRQFVKLWSIPDELVQAGADAPVLQLVTSQMADPLAFLERVRYLYAHKEEIGSEELQLADGRVFERHTAPVVGENGQYYGRVWHFRDISERKEAEKQQLMALSIFNESSQAMMITDTGNTILDVNPAFTRITGYDAVEVIGKNPSLLSSGRHDQDFYRNMWYALDSKQHWEGEIWNRRKNGELFAEWMIVNAIRDKAGITQNFVALFSDITERKRSEELVWKHANYDELTQLPNRRLFLDRLEYEIKKMRRTGNRLALLFIDLDHFKEVNDTLGHHAGDFLLAEAAHRISTCVRDSDTVARRGGDEFTAIIPDLRETAPIERIARALVERLGRTFHLENHKAHISASIGIALYPSDTDDAEQLIAQADKAMYLSKEKGRNCYSFYSELRNKDHRPVSEAQ